MADWPYSDDELKAYFSDPDKRRSGGHPLDAPTGGGSAKRPRAGDLPGSRWSNDWFARRFKNRNLASAARAITVMGVVLAIMTIAMAGYFISIYDELPSLTEIENPDFQLATIAYTADGEELARYARQNRAWATFRQISPFVIDALVSTEDHRFYDHWGMDLLRTVSSVVKTVLAKIGIPGFITQGGSTISQQLARNLYNKRIGRQQTVGRKMKEWVTAVELERRFTKPEIIEMYLNTVEFGYNAWGIETASWTFFGKAPINLDELESATLVGMLQLITYYNPVRNPENSRRRRNVVLAQMVKRGKLDAAFLEAHRDDPVVAEYKSYDVTASLAPYFAEHVRNWMNAWSKANGYDFYEDGLVVYTTLDSRLQKMAEDALTSKLDCLQAVVDFEWSRRSDAVWSTEVCDYKKLEDYEPFSYMWKDQPELMDQLIKETERYRLARNRGEDLAAVIQELKQQPAFIDSMRATKQRLEAGFVAMDPTTGSVKAWVGGRELATDWFDHVDKAARQPGSTFKPFVYTAAIDNGWSPYYTLLDDSLHYVDAQGNEWNPVNSGEITGRMITLREGLSRSLNTITARLMLEVGPPEVAFIARRMGIKSPLLEVPALALGTSDVTLLEMVTAYATLADGGLRHDATVVTRIEDRNGNVLYEATPTPREALSEQTAFTMVDMLRGVITAGTGRRIRVQYNLGEYDLAGKTGTTQNNADGWFMMMHPELVMGSWVGFNDRRFAFRSEWWGQGAHNALFVVGDFFRAAAAAGLVDKERRFPPPNRFDEPERVLSDDPTELRTGRGRVGW